MLKLAVIFLVLQIGFNVALNYRGYNYNPLNPTSDLMNYGQTRRLFNPNRYLPLSARRNLDSDSEQSESEDTSGEETGFRALHSLQNQPYSRRGNLKYATLSDNDVSLEIAPIGRMGLNTYQSALSATTQMNTNFRRPYLRHILPDFRQNQNRKSLFVDLAASSVDGNSAGDITKESSVDSLGENLKDANYLRSHTNLPHTELPNLRQDENLQYQRRVNNDLRLEVLPLATSNSDNEAMSNAVSNFETSYYRRVNSDSEKSLTRNANPADNSDNGNALFQSNLGISNTRRNNLNIENPNNDLRFGSLDSDGEDAFMDTVFLVPGDGDNVAIARPQLRSSQVTNDNRKKYDNLGLKLSSDVELTPDKDSSSNLSSYLELRKSLRRNDQQDNSPNLYQEYNRRDLNVGLDSILNDKTKDNSFKDLSILHVASINDMNVDSPLLRSHDNNRRDDDEDANLRYTSNDGVNLNDDSANNLLVLRRTSLNNLNVESSLQNNNRRDNNDIAPFQPDLRVHGLDQLNLLLSNLRNNELLNQENSRRDDNNNDRRNAEEDTQDNVLVPRSLNLNDLLTNRKQSNKNKNRRQSIKDDSNVLVLTDKLNPNDENINKLVPYHEHGLNNENQNYSRRDSDDVHLELSPNDRLNLNENVDSNLSVLRTISFDNSGLVTSPPKNRNQTNLYDNEKNIRRYDDEINPDDSPFLRKNRDKNKPSKKDPFELNLEYPWNDKLSPDVNHNLSSSREHKSGVRKHHEKKQHQDNSELHLDYPWNDVLSSDISDTTIPSAYRSGSQDNDRSYLRHRSKNRNSKRRALPYNDLSLRELPLYNANNNEDSMLGDLENNFNTRSYLRNLYRNINENRNLRAPPDARERPVNSTELLIESSEDTSFIAFPLDRRPSVRQRSHDNDNRRTNIPLAITTTSSNTEMLLEENESYNDSTR